MEPCFVQALHVFTRAESTTHTSRIVPKCAVRSDAESKNAVARARQVQPPAKIATRITGQTDSVTAFFRDIQQYRLLSPDEERELTLKVSRLREHSKARKALAESECGMPSDEAIAEALGISLSQYFTEQSAGLAARDSLVAANLRLVVKIARAVLRRKRRNSEGAPLLDIVQEGALGLLRAADAFDPTRGVRFSTFAWLAVRRSCERAVATSFAMHVPERFVKASNKLRAASAEFFVTHGRWPNDSELATILPEIDVQSVRLAEVRMQQMLELDRPLLSAAPNGDGAVVTLGNFVPDDQNPTPESVLEEEFARERVRASLRKILKPREAKVLVLRFGLDEKAPISGKDIAEVFELSEVRVSQIVSASLKKLRKHDPELVELM